eukprot:1321024-Amphidinium_carterae.1
MSLARSAGIKILSQMYHTLGEKLEALPVHHEDAEFLKSAGCSDASSSPVCSRLAQDGLEKRCSIEEMQCGGMVAQYLASCQMRSFPTDTLTRPQRSSCTVSACARWISSLTQLHLLEDSFLCSWLDIDAKVKSLGLFADGMSTQSLLWFVCNAMHHGPMTIILWMFDRGTSQCLRMSRT